MTKKPKEVQYKDTFEFRLFPEYSYTVAQKKRLRLFQGRVEHWRKAINYADSFRDGDKINLLYMVGYHEKMRDYVQKTKSNLVVLCVKFSLEELADYDAYWDFLDKLRGAGLLNGDGAISKLYYENRDAVMLCKQIDPNDAVVCGAAEQYTAEAEIVARYERLKRISKKRFERYTILDKLHPEKTIAHENLNWIIKRYYPRGRERHGFSDKAYKGLKLVSDALTAGIQKDDFSKSMGLDGSIPLWEICKPEIKRCEMNLNIAIRARGNVNLADIFHEMQKPPYGWGLMDAHAAYCFGYALSGFMENSYCWDGVSSFTACEAMIAFAGQVVRGQDLVAINKSREYILYTEDGWRMVNRLSEIFGVEKTMPLTTMVVRVCCAIEQHTRFPVAILDGELFRLFNIRYSDRGLTETQVVRNFIRHFDWERCERLRHDYQHINSIVPEMVRNRFAEASVEEMTRYCTTECSGWGWDANMFWDVIERYYGKAGEQL